MNLVPPIRVDEELWSSALLAADTELLLGAARNYLGPVKTPYDKREIVERLKAFLRRAEVRTAILALLDELDARILGSFFLIGPVPEVEIRTLFEGELPLFDLGIRLANLLDRLLLFRFESGGRRLLAPNPILADALAEVVLDPLSVFGLRPPVAPSAAPETSASAEGPQAGPPTGCEETVAGLRVGAQDLVALFVFLFHNPGWIRKGGGLTKKAQERAEALLPESLRQSADRLAALLRAFDAAGFLGAGTEGREPDLAVFSAALGAWGASLPAYLAAALATGRSGEAELVFEGRGHVAEMAASATVALEAVPGGFLFSRGGLNRWLEIALRRSGRAQESAAAERRELVEALLALGLVVETEGGYRVPGRPGGAEAGSERPTLVAEGSHALHLLPEAGLAERLFVGTLARPIGFGTAWSFEVDRESARRAFSVGFSAAQGVERLAALAGRALPQSLSFSLKAWEEEYLSLRLYRGFVLVADERMRSIIEHSRALAPRIAERLGPGIYVLAVSGAEEAAELIEEAGLEAPPETHYGSSAHAGPGQAPARTGFPAAGEEARGGPIFEAAQLADQAEVSGATMAKLIARASGAVAALAALKPREVPPLDPRRQIGFLLASLESSVFGVGEASEQPDLGQGAAATKAAAARNAAELRELSDRIERRLILTPRQLATAEVRPERLEATGLDYMGKVRIVERALRSPGDRLEMLYRLPGAEPTRVLVRPVRLEKTEKGLVLEAEDLGTGEPIRVSLGAASSVRRMRASLFGEDR